MPVNERINEFDIIKAIAIIMMVFGGHISLPGTHLFVSYGCVFHSFWSCL